MGAWGGYPYLAFGYISSWFNAGSFQNATNYKIAGGYDLSKDIIDGLRIDMQYLYIDLDEEYAFNAGGESESYQKSYGLLLGFESKDGPYASFRYEYTDIQNEPRLHSLYLFAGYSF